MLPAQPNRSLIDGLRVLQAVSAAREGLGGRELGRLLDLESTRVHRLLKTLAHLGLTRQGRDRRYYPGPAIHVLGVQALNASGLLRAAAGPVEALRSRPGVHQVAVGVLWQTDVCYLLHVARSTNLLDALGHDRLFPALASGIGLALLASETDEALAVRYRGDPKISEVLHAVAATRARNYAWVAHENGLASLGVPIPGGDHPVAGLTVVTKARTAPSVRLVKQVTSAAAAIGKALEAA